MRFVLVVCVIAAGRIGIAQETPRPPRQPRIHDPSTIVRSGDHYWTFTTGMGVASWKSKDLISWEPGPPVFKDPPKWITDVVPTQRGHFWAPDIIRVGDRDLLYYSVSTFGKQTSAIALASRPAADGGGDWTDHGIVIQTTLDSDYNAIDPGLIQTSGGELWMAFGSFWSGIKLVQLDPKTGLRLAPDSPVTSLAWKEQIEAVALYEHDGWFYQFVNWGWCCKGVNSTYNIRVGRSRSITGPYLDQDGRDLLQGGGSLVLETEGDDIGPGHAGILRAGDRFWMSYHFYDGRQQGRSRLAIRPLEWTSDGWPKIAGEPVTRAP